MSWLRGLEGGKFNIRELKESEMLLKECSRILDVPVHDVPKVVKNLLSQRNEFEAKIEKFTQ